MFTFRLLLIVIAYMNEKSDTFFDSGQAISQISQFLQDSLADSHLDGYVVGLSGGIDSAVAAALAVKAVGPEKLFGIMMPYKSSSDSSRTDAQILANKFQIETTCIDISPMVDAYFEIIPDDNRLRQGNKMARERMSILFDHAHRMNRLVLGTGNRTEIALGYTTLYGDAACSVNPIGQLYKTEVRLIARELGIPDSIINKPPSADLWANQTDESEIGVTYKEIDQILSSLLDKGIRSASELESAGINLDSTKRLLELLNLNKFKRILPPIADLGKSPVPKQILLGA